MIDEIIEFALKEDIGAGDHTSLSCIPENATGKAKLLIKDTGILAGVALAEKIFHRVDPGLRLEVFISDGAHITPGDIAFEVTGSSRSILSSERLVLNFMQRMSGIATQTHSIVQLIEGTGAKLLDTRKTTPGIRAIEKCAVKIGGGENHRFGLYDMIMIKDNHVDYAGGITAAVERTRNYLAEKQLDLKIEVEVRNETELNEALSVSGIDRVMLDNFSPEEIQKVLSRIPSHIETEASGGITKENIRRYAETGINFISSGALTHSVKSLDMSLKAEFH